MGLHIGARGRVMVVTLNNPKSRNALDMETLRALGDLMDGLAYRDPLPLKLPDGELDIGGKGHFRPHAVVLRSEGKVFCAGADLQEMKALGAADFQTNLTAALEMGAVFRSVRNCPAPVIARVHGAAYGGGVGLVAACDVVVAGTEAHFTFSEAKLGLVPGVISPLVVDRIGMSAGRHFFLTADPISALEAHRLGLVDRLVATEDLDKEIAGVVNSILKCGPEALGMCKGLLDGGQSLGYARSGDFTARMIAEARTKPEAQAALQAFFANENAPWVGSDPWTLPPSVANEDS